VNASRASAFQGCARDSPVTEVLGSTSRTLLFAECVALPAAYELWEPISGSRSRLCVPRQQVCRELLPGESRQVVYWPAPFARHNDHTERVHSWRPRMLSAAEVCRLRCHWRNMRGLDALGLAAVFGPRLPGFITGTNNHENPTTAEQMDGSERRADGQTARDQSIYACIVLTHSRLLHQSCQVAAGRARCVLAESGRLDQAR